MNIRSPWLIGAFLFVLITEAIKHVIDWYDTSSMFDVGWTHYTPHSSFWDSLTAYQWVLAINLLAYAVFAFVLLLNVYCYRKKKHQGEPWDEYQ